jgi:exopolysaccharide production protein ExoQ
MLRHADTLPIAGKQTVQEGTMPQKAALFISVLFIIWLFVRDQKLRPMTSWALWLPLLWIVIIGSKALSTWFGGGIELSPSEFYEEGSQLERIVFSLFIVAGAAVVWRRRLEWRSIFDWNPWFFAFFIYCGISIIWSDYPFVSFKRWTKELGDIFMLLIILTEEAPIQATRAVLARYAYFAIPLSVVLINFFPTLGIYYSPTGEEPGYCGVMMDKNALGLLTFISGLFFVWDLIYFRRSDGRSYDWMDLSGRIVLMSMVAWLIYMAHSSTALVCLVIGTGVLLLMKSTFFRRQVRYLGTYSLILGSLLLMFYTLPGILDTFVEMVGRDTTFTGRTDLWADLLSEHINPLLGTGYQSFWLGSRLDYIWQIYPWHPLQAHNGYLEVFLNGGLIGLCLLIGMILFAGRNLKKEVLLENSFAILLFAYFVAGVFYNWTEAKFSRIDLLWFIMGIAVLYCPPTYEYIPEEMSPTGQGDT